MAQVPIEIVNRRHYVYYFNDFIQDRDYDAANEFTLTQVGAAGSADFIQADNAANGVLRLTVAGANTGPIVQLDGDEGTSNESAPIVVPAAAVAGTSIASRHWMGARVALRDADATDAFIGLAELNATSAVLTGAGALTSDNCAGFHLLDASNGVFTFSAAGTATANTQQVAAVVTAADDTWIEFGVEIIGNRWARGYVNGALVGTIDNGANVFNDNMFITLAAIGGAAGDDLDVDYVWLSYKRNLLVGPDGTSLSV